MKNLIKKVIWTYQHEGVHAIFRKTRVYFNKTKEETSQKISKIDLGNLPVMPQLEDIAKADYLKFPYHKPAKVKKSTLDIAWVSPPVGPGGGGHTTISRFIKYLQKQGHHITFYVYDNNTIHQSLAEIKTILSSSYHIDVAVANLSNFGNHDVVFATSWETAYPVFNIKNPNLHKFYFVQDFEPLFYGVGSRYKLAEATYKFGFYGITAGKWLAHKVAEYGMDADYFNFGAEIDIYRPKGEIKKKKQVAFYARAHTERRGFEIGVMALKIFKDKHPDYDIVFFGQGMESYDIPFEFIDRGILTKEELAEIYHESVACLVLSLTNVSLLPLELLVSGCIPVMNSGENNTMVLGDTPHIAYTEAYPVHLANELSKAVERDNIDLYAQEMSNFYEGMSWEKSYQKVEEIIKREVCDV
ncbi:glycosyltransferase family 1 protein [Streptococcus sp. SGI.013]|uniref:rhamnosyltransferase WsaF family glycosyltransferase n=1 Tax=unclassified Streptococcus TaxID=2608887 RepID=UPI003CFD3A65